VYMPPTAMMQRQSGPFAFSLQLLRPSLALKLAGLIIDGWVWWKRGWSAAALALRRGHVLGSVIGAHDNAMVVARTGFG
ncbi:hypothetical protein U1Q18_038008, partial [Sarracenia purpurea var. burkii]